MLQSNYWMCRCISNNIHPPTQPGCPYCQSLANTSSRASAEDVIKYIKGKKIVTGDLLKLAASGSFHVIVHGCNCFCRMGGGIAYQIAKKWPIAAAVDRTFNVPQGAARFGLVSVAENDPMGRLTIINGYTQIRPGVALRNEDRLDAIRKVFEYVALHYRYMKIGYPKIGAGLAGGDWDEISPVIDTALDGCDHTLVLWDQE